MEHRYPGIVQSDGILRSDMRVVHRHAGVCGTQRWYTARTDHWDGVLDSRQVCWQGTLRYCTGVLGGIPGWYQDLIHRDGTWVH